MTFRFAGALLRFVDYESQVVIDARTLGGALDALVEAHPELASVLFDRQGQLRPSHRMFLNGETVFGSELDRQLEPADCVDILTAISGG